MGRKPLAPEDIKLEVKFEGDEDESRKLLLEVIKIILEGLNYQR